MARLRACFNWAVEHDYMASNPFLRNGVAVIKLARGAETPRHRRLEAGEEEKLLAAANAHLRAMMIAALETGCRLGELLSLQWHQVRFDQNVLVLPASKTKTGEHRNVPITSRLRQVLEFRHRDVAGELFGPDAYVFGNEVGEPTKSIRTAWENCRKRAGVVGLHWHDLRRETASRLLETPGVALHDVAEWIGHSSVTTTARYLSTSAIRRQHTLRPFEEHRRQKASNSEAAEAVPRPEVDDAVIEARPVS